MKKKSLISGYLRRILAVMFVVFELIGVIYSVSNYNHEKTQFTKLYNDENISKDRYELLLDNSKDNAIINFLLYTLFLFISIYLCNFVYEKEASRAKKKIDDFIALLLEGIQNRKELQVGDNLEYSEFEKIANYFNQILKDIHFKENYNSLTKLPKRKKFIKDSLYLLNEKGLPVIIAYIHLKDYKDLLKSRSFELADKVIVELSKRLLNFAKNIDNSRVAKISGNGDFLLSFPCPKYPEACYNLISKKLHECFGEKINLGIEGSFELGIGVGFGLLNHDNKEVILDNVYKAAILSTLHKHQLFCTYTDELKLQIDVEAKLETDLKIAVEQQLLEVYYQAKINTKTDKVSGAEALVRWLRYNKFENTEKFVKVAEQSNLIINLERLVITKVFKDQRWLQDNNIFMPISINISAKHLLHDSFIPTLEQKLKEYNIESKYIEIEIVEREKLDESESLEILKKLKKLGFSLSIDDFGKDYSSLTYINNLPIDSIKIDKSFVDGLVDEDELISENSKAIINGVIKIAKSINKKTIAEGVETLEQVKCLKDLGCDELQGFYYHKGATPLNNFLEIYKNKLERL